MATKTFNPQFQEEQKTKEHTDKAKETGADALNKAKDAGKDVMHKAGETASTAVDKIKDAGKDVMHKAADAGSTAMDKAKEIGGDMLGKAKDAASSVGEYASNAASAVGHKADDLTSAAGHGIKSFGETMAQKAPHEGITGTGAQAVADTIKGSGRYLEEAKLSGMAQDIEQVVKNHPLPSLLITFGVGFCLGRMLAD